MASIRETWEILAEATGVDVNIVRQIARYLGEADLLGPRIPGRRPFQLEPIHTARLIVGLLAMSSIGRPMTKMPELVPVVIEALEQDGAVDFDISEDERTGKAKITPRGGFTQWIVRMVSWLDDHSFAEKFCEAASITFASDGQFYARLELRRGSGSHTIIFGDADAVEAAGLTRTVKITGSAIAKVAAAIAPDEAQQESGPRAEASEPLRSASPSGDGSTQRHRTDTHAGVQDGDADLSDGPQHHGDPPHERSKTAERAAA